MNGDKYKELYEDSKEQNHVLQDERTKLMDMLRTKDKSKFDELSNINQMYTDARRECDRLLEVNLNLTTDGVKLRTALSTMEQRFEDLTKEFNMYKINSERANDAKIFVKQSEILESRDKLIQLEKERDSWRAKEESLRNDLLFLKEVNMKSHEITKNEYEQKIKEIKKDHA